jgi:hypothetical protein
VSPISSFGSSERRLRIWRVDSFTSPLWRSGSSQGMGGITSKPSKEVLPGSVADALACQRLRPKPPPPGRSALGPIRLLACFVDT